VQSAYRPGSVLRRGVGPHKSASPAPDGWAIIHLEPALPPASSDLPGVFEAGRSMSPAWSCSEWGLPSRPGRPGRWCALTAPFHPYQMPGRIRSHTFGGLLSVALSTGCPAWELPSTLPCGARTFLSPPPKRRAATARPTASLLYKHPLAESPRAQEGSLRPVL
jgi:hypothetical protein